MFTWVLVDVGKPGSERADRMEKEVVMREQGGMNIKQNWTTAFPKNDSDQPPAPLHWLPERSRTDFETVLLTCKASKPRPQQSICSYLWFPELPEVEPPVIELHVQVPLYL